MMCAPLLLAKVCSLRKQLKQLEEESADVAALRVKAASLEDRLSRGKADLERLQAEHEEEKKKARSEVRGVKSGHRLHVR